MAVKFVTHTPVIPYILYRDVPAALEWLARAFGFAERMRTHTPRSGTHGEMLVGDQLVMMGQGSSPLSFRSRCAGRGSAVRRSASMSATRAAVNLAGAVDAGESAPIPRPTILPSAPFSPFILAMYATMAFMSLESLGTTRWTRRSSQVRFAASASTRPNAPSATDRMGRARRRLTEAGSFRRFGAIPRSTPAPGWRRRSPQPRSSGRTCRSRAGRYSRWDRAGSLTRTPSTSRTTLPINHGRFSPPKPMEDVDGRNPFPNVERFGDSNPRHARRTRRSRIVARGTHRGDSGSHVRGDDTLRCGARRLRERFCRNGRPLFRRPKKGRSLLSAPRAASGGSVGAGLHAVSAQACRRYGRRDAANDAVVEPPAPAL